MIEKNASFIELMNNSSGFSFNYIYNKLIWFFTMFSSCYCK